MQTVDGFTMLASKETSLVLDAAIGGRPRILHWGNNFGSASPALLKRLLTRQHAPGSTDQDITPTLLNETGIGLSAASGLRAHRNGQDWAQIFKVRSVDRPSDDTAIIISQDQTCQIETVTSFTLNPVSQILEIATTIKNIGEAPLHLDHCAAAILPLDPRAKRLFGFSGCWANEFQMEEIANFTGSYVRENKRGRTSHDAFPGLLAAATNTSEEAGICFGIHLGWSGNSQIRVDRQSDGQAFVQLSDLFFPGEMVLQPGESYQSPTAFAGFSENGLTGLSQQFQTHVRKSIMDGRLRAKPRPVHYNTWEAVYFDHDQDKLFQLAKKAAALGVERFILDDGWFGARRNDKAGLGDWWPSPDIYPNGLTPLIDHVTSLGMEFGLWVEPEMVNPDSDLFRTHPDWVLCAEGVEQISSRHQLVLDLTREEVCDYLFNALKKLLEENNISYLKWDMNRDSHHPGSKGIASTHYQTRALYYLIKRLRQAYPEVEIESCASGGGRADYGILEHTDRIWTSDSNDALDRLTIQRGASHFFPLEVLGAHVGPETCHITGRRLSMDLRIATALFGHMGLELNLLEENAEDLETLKRGIALYKAHRDLLHSGNVHRLTTPSHVNAIGVISEDRKQALFSWCNLRGHRETHPGRIYFTGLAPDQNYRLSIIWPDPVVSISSPSILGALDLNQEGTCVPGEVLVKFGMQLPLLFPETCLVFKLIAET